MRGRFNLKGRKMKWISFVYFLHRAVIFTPVFCKEIVYVGYSYV